jgi:glucosyl-3-phosphoglycerate synthase
MRTDVRAWFARRTSSAGDWPVPLLTELKAEHRVSVVLPALNEEATVGGVVACIVDLAERTGLVDEVVLVDSGSTDATAEVAAAAGAKVVLGEEVLPGLGSRAGKGEVLWKSLAATTGDVIVFVDSDLLRPRPEFVTGLLGPLFGDPEVELVKGCYDRPLNGEGPTSGGRVTELVARPLLNLHFPELAGVVQPLSGEYAGRRSLLERLPFGSGYGVEIGLLVDTWRLRGLDRIAQVDLGDRDHVHQDVPALTKMAVEINMTVAARIGSTAAGIPPGGDATELVQFHRRNGRFEPMMSPVTIRERPPMATVRATAG